MRPPPAGTIAPARTSSCSRASVTCVPRLGRIRGTSSSSYSSSGRSRSAHTPVAFTTFVAAQLELAAADRVAHEHPGRAAGALHEAGHLAAVRHHRAEALRLAEDGEHEPGVVGLAVVEEVARGRRRGPRAPGAAPPPRPRRSSGAAPGSTPRPRRGRGARTSRRTCSAPRRGAGPGACRRRSARSAGAASPGAARASRAASARAAPRARGRGRSSGGSGGRRARASTSGSRCPPRSPTSPRARRCSRATRRRARRRRR